MWRSAGEGDGGKKGEGEGGRGKVRGRKNMEGMRLGVEGRGRESRRWEGWGKDEKGGLR